jgi:Domain of unknown function (DUF4281)
VKALDLYFKLATALSLPAWLLLIAAPTSAHTEALVRYGSGVALCLLYVWLLFGARSLDTEKPRGNFFSLGGVVSLFKSPRVVLAGWVHFLAFDLWVALWIRSDAQALHITHWMLIPIYLLTLMFGPLGVLAYLLLRWAAV